MNGDAQRSVPDAQNDARTYQLAADLLRILSRKVKRDNTASMPIEPRWVRRDWPSHLSTQRKEFLSCRLSRFQDPCCKAALWVMTPIVQQEFEARVQTQQSYMVRRATLVASRGILKPLALSDKFMARIERVPTRKNIRKPFEPRASNEQQTRTLWSHHPLVPIGSRIIDRDLTDIERKDPHALNRIDKDLSTSAMRNVTDILQIDPVARGVPNPTETHQTRCPIDSRCQLR